MAKTFVIAEMGSCHDGDLQKAIRLVHAAADCGANAVKAQWVSSPERLAEHRNAGEYVKHYRLISFPRGWFDVLRAEADKCGIEFMCTAFLPQDIQVIAQYAKRAKVSSFESPDLAFVREHDAWFGEVIVSYSGGMKPHDLSDKYKSLLCVSAYPCPIDQLGLRRLHSQEDTIMGLYTPFDGLSDHTANVLTGALAVAAGAIIVEAHIRLEETDPKNADWAHSLIADQKHRRDESFYEYVSNIHLAEQALGDGRTGPMPCEEPMMRFKVKA